MSQHFPQRNLECFRCKKSFPEGKMIWRRILKRERPFCAKCIKVINDSRQRETFIRELEAKNKPAPSMGDPMMEAIVSGMSGQPKILARKPAKLKVDHFSLDKLAASQKVMIELRQALVDAEAILHRAIFAAHRAGNSYKSITEMTSLSTTRIKEIIEEQWKAQ